MARPYLWLRCETKQFERRTALTPDSAKKLVEAGFHVYVERDKQRIFKDAEYERLVVISDLSDFFLGILLISL